jgi:hypothetical protein
MSEPEGYVPPTDEEIAALEHSVYTTGEGALTRKDLTKKLFLENGPDAALTIIHLAKKASSETVKLRAATYIADRVLGPVGAEKSPEEDEPLEKMIAKFGELADAGRVESADEE